MSGRDDGRFQTGRNSGPSRTNGFRSKLSEAFLPALLNDFERHGAVTIERVREADPAGYLRVVASIIPKHLAIDDASEINTMTDEELDARIRELDRQLAAGRADEVGS